jgi:hypothetical protein
MAQVNGTLYLIGGEGSGSVLNKVHAYDAGSNAWRRVPDLPEGRHGMGAVTLGNLLYVPGGGFQNGLGPSARVFAFVVTQADPLPYQQWARGFFSVGDPSGPAEDFDADGLTNLEEFALNLDPGVVSVASPPRLSIGETHQLVLEYERGRGRDVQWELLLSTNLTQWNLAVSTVDWVPRASLDLGLGLERFSIEVLPRGRDRLFLRLRPQLPMTNGSQAIIH